ncbi:iron-sulfur cluster carrier protein ApbC [Oricola sp.]|uniref:iron-sulfur cluster carrier protein ApbC n=1 Tax=Oricola sp. TaxID=1979950 RepID=UPI0025E11BD7|nr:iron-sulfur cluster carrier protein ApbC [Oricola sp.]MCI5073879.1 iron-sulfur cluster carrier protein ApbC [Oricola sp.]
MAIKDLVLEQLKRVKGPDLTGNIVDLGLVSEIVEAGSKVFFSVTVPAERAEELEPLREAAERAALGVPGVEKAGVVLTAAKTAGSPSSQPRPAPQPARQVPPQGGGPRKPAGIPGIASIVAVASGKGGVGKSTTAVNLALALKGLGLKVGILDADIYGPSMPRLMGITGKPTTIDGRTLKPMENYGVKVMSMGFLVEEDTPMIWRGPMVISALNQMLKEVAWGELDVLVVDMPPGTGDAQLTMAQNVPLAGAVIVSTPQDLALIDARKGLNMFRKVEVPVLGIIENMSYFICPDCGSRHDIFSHGGAEKEAEKLGVPFLGGVPLTMDIREKSDAGTPIVVFDPDSPNAEVYRKIARQVQQRIGAAQQAAPSIVFD